MTHPLSWIEFSRILTISILNFIVFCGSFFVFILLPILYGLLFLVLFLLLFPLLRSGEIDPLLLDDQRPLHDALVDGEDILADQPDEKDLDRSQKQHAQKHGCHTCQETVPPDQLHDQVDESDKKARHAAERADKRGDPQPRLRIGGKAQHGRVVQPVEIVAGLAGPALRLLIGDLLAAVAQLRHDPPQKRRRVIQPAQHFDKIPVIQARTGKMLDLLHIGQLVDHLIVAAPEPVHDPVLSAAGLDSDDDLVAFLPLCNELRNELNYCISDTELVSLLWLREYKRVTTLPSDVLIANAHAACRVSNEVMERAIQIAHSMKETGTLTIDAALLVSAHSEFASFLAEQVRNDPAELNESSVKSLISGFIEKQSEQKVITARNEEKALAEKKLSSQKVLHESISAKNQERFQSYENQIAALQKEKQDTSTLQRIQRKRIVELADKQAKRVSTLVYVALYCILFFALGTLCTIFTIHSITEYCAGNVWLPYLVVDFLSFLGILQLFLPRKSFVVHLICRVRDRVYGAVYSQQVQKYEDLIMQKLG